MKVVRTLAVVGVIAVLAGCEKKEIKTYRVSKQVEPASPHAGHAHAGMPGGMGSGMPGGMGGAMGGGAMGGGMDVSAAERSGPAATFDTPSGWEAQPKAAMREASFLAKGDDGAVADISLIILEGEAGKTLDNVNRWLNQLGQPPVTSDRLGQISEKVTTNIGEVLVVDLQGLPEGADPKKDGRIIGAILAREGETWFFKMRGNAALTEAEKAHFIDWVKSTRTAAQAPSTAQQNASESKPASPHGGQMAAQPAEESAGASPKWTAPKEWKSLPVSGMRFASFEAGDASGAPADISVMSLPGDSGGDLSNVNRWRQQVGLPPVTDTDLNSQVKPVGSAGMKLVDLAGAEKRMMAGWVRNGDQTWFFKLTGSPSVVEAEKERFLAFLGSVKFE